MKFSQWIALVMFIGCISLAAYSLTNSDKDITNKSLALVGLVVSGFFGKELTNETGNE